MEKFFPLLMAILLSTQIAFADKEDMSTKVIEQRIKPIGQVQIGAPAKPLVAPAPAIPATTAGVAPGVQVSQPPTTSHATTTAPAGTSVPQKAIAANEGEKIYKTYCFACHATGASGSPKFGDANAWAPRIRQGMPTLVSHATSGYKLMPPKGTCMNCTNDQIAAAVKYMVSNSQKTEKGR